MVADNDYLTFELPSFNMIKSFYSIQDGFHNNFTIVMRKQEGDDVFEYERSIPEGNHNVRLWLDALFGLSLGLLNIFQNK